jgi:WD40 repeat protein
MRVRHGKSVTGVAFAPDGKTVASTAFWDIVRLWDRGTGRQLGTLPRGKHKEVGSCLAFSPNGKTLATALVSTNSYVALWDLQAEERRTQFDTGNFSFGRRVTVLAYSADGKRLACGTSRSGRFVGRPLEVRMQTAVGGPRVVVAESGGNVLSLALSPDGLLLAVGLEEGEIVLWDVAAGDRCESQPQKQGKGLSLAFSPNGQTLAGSIGRKVYLWDVESGEVRGTLAGHTAEVRSVVFAPDGRTLLTGSKDGTARRWEVATGKELAAFVWDIGLTNSVALAPDGLSAAAGGNSGDLVIWDLGGPAGS